MAVELEPPANLPPCAPQPFAARAPAGIRHALQVSQRAAAAVVPDHLGRVVVRTAPAGVLIEVGDARVRSRDRKVHVEDRLVPAEVAARPQRRGLHPADAAVPRGNLVGREPEVQPGEAVLVRRDEHAAEEVTAGTKAEDPCGDVGAGGERGRKLVTLEVVIRDDVAELVPLRDEEVAELAGLPERGLEAAEHGGAGVEPEHALRLELHPRPRLPREALRPVGRERRHRTALDSGDRVDEGSLVIRHAEVEGDDAVEHVRVRLHGPDEVDEVVAVRGVRGAREDVVSHRPGRRPRLRARAGARGR